MNDHRDVFALEMKMLNKIHGCTVEMQYVRFSTNVIICSFLSLKESTNAREGEASEAAGCKHFVIGRDQGTFLGRSCVFIRSLSGSVVIPSSILLEPHSCCANIHINLKVTAINKATKLLDPNENFSFWRKFRSAVHELRVHADCLKERYTMFIPASNLNSQKKKKLYVS